MLRNGAFCWDLLLEEYTKRSLKTKDSQVKKMKEHYLEDGNGQASNREVRI
jgi:hypothetical protein